jgi:hypothetical protein
MAYEPVRRPTRRRPLRRAVLLSGAALLLLCCIGAAGLGAWNFQSIRQSAGPARQAAAAFLTDVTAGDATGAYDRLCAATRQRWSRPEFAALIGAPPRISRYALRDVSVATQDGKPRGSVTAELTMDSGRVDSRKLVMVRDGGAWRVCGDPF